MEAATITEPPVGAEPDTSAAPAPAAEVETPVETSPAPEQTAAKLFKYSEWLHAGDGAEECAERFTGRCQDEDHFHAWVRLPNQFQHDAIREKAMAAKARRARQMRDPDTDAHALLEADLDSLRTSEKTLLVDEVAAKDSFKSHLDAVSELGEEEEYATIEEDKERLKVIAALPEEERNSDELLELEKHVSGYTDRVEARRAELEGPLRSALEQKSAEELVDLLRDDRIEAETLQEFMRQFTAWQMFSCTLRPRGVNEDGTPKRPQDPVWGDIEAMRRDSAEALAAVADVFSELERNQRESQGNS